MMYTMKKEDFIDGLIKASSIIPSRSGAAYLRSIWMKAEENSLTLMATDANIEFTGSYPAHVEKPGLVGVNGRQFVDLVRRLPQGELKISLEEERGLLILQQGRRTYKLPINESTWFQPLVPFPTEGSVVWSGDFFQELIDRVFFCISDDEASDGLSCLYIKKNASEAGSIELCGLNGHQFALTKFVHDDLAAILPEDGILIQRKYMAELRKWLDQSEIDINLSEKRLFVRSGDGKEMCSVPRASYSYPDYTAFLGRLSEPGASLLKLNRKECLDALDRISLFNTETDRCTYFALSSVEAILSVQGQGTGSANEFLDTTYNGSIEHIAFPTKNLMEILGHYQSTELELTLTTPEGPCGIKGHDDPDYIVLIMPMKIADMSYYEES